MLLIRKRFFGELGFSLVMVTSCVAAVAGMIHSVSYLNELGTGCGTVLLAIRGEVSHWAPVTASLSLIGGSIACHQKVAVAISRIGMLVTTLFCAAALFVVYKW